jgi:Ca-activated chloride channel family protein
MTFLSPGRLWILAGLALLAVLYVLGTRRRTPYAARFTQLSLLASVAPRSATWKRHVPAGLLLLAMALLTVGFARPEGVVQVPRERATIVVALDTSLSMNAEDVSPTRDAAARRAATAFVESLPRRFNVGLVAFNGTSSIAVAPTQDHDAVVEAIGDLSLGESTAIGEAVFSSLDALTQLPSSSSDTEPPPARIVLLSDGTNTVGRRVSAAIDAANDAGVPVSTIAFGTQEGTVSVGGQEIPVPVDRRTLRLLAEDTGGTSYVAESGDALSSVYDDIGSQVGTTTEKREVSTRWAGYGLGVAALAALASLAWGVRFP